MTETLWDFAVSIYRRNGVAQCCLRLQDDIGADINMLLTAAWLAERGQCWQAEQVRALMARCAEWREQCILPLRAVRRYLQGHPLYASIKPLEVEAEIHQLHLLNEALQQMSLTPGERADALRTNLQTYFDVVSSNRSCSEYADRQTLIDLLTA